MSTLTKISIVLMVLLAIVASVLFIQLSNTTANYRDAWEAQKRMVAARTALVGTRDGQLDRLKNQYNALKTQSGDDLASRQQLLDGKQRELDSALGRIASLETTVANLQAANAGLTASVKQQVSHNSKLSQLLDTQLSAAQTLKAKLRDLELSLKTEKQEREHAIAAAMAMNQDLVKAMEKVKALEDEILSYRGVKDRDISPTPISPIEARVTAVDIKENAASINVGSASGVKKGMQFFLSRGDQLVGVLRVLSVDSNSSAGLLSDIQMTPQAGDKAGTSVGSE